MYENHPSNISVKQHLCQATCYDILQIINDLKGNTSIDIDKSLAKLVKTASEVIAGPLRELANESLFAQLLFPGFEKHASVTPAF